MRKREGFIYSGIVWTLIFSLMSFYWAAGGMLGVESIGGEVYQKALERDSTFIPIVWLTGFIKLIGCFLLGSLLLVNRNERIRNILLIVSRVAGIFLFFYGLLNFITISLAGLSILSFDLTVYAMKWRLIFWEPFWMLGGILYWLSGRKDVVST